MASDLFSRVYYPWRALPGGIDVSVIPIRVSRSIGRAEEELLDMHLEGLKSFIKREAEGFGEPVQADSFRKLTGLLRDGRAHAYLVTVDWTNAAKELVLPREIRDQLTARQNGSNYTKKEIVGGAVEHPTVFLSKGQDGNITFWPGIHGEDSYTSS
jgi:hypothetical protein